MDVRWAGRSGGLELGEDRVLIVVGSVWLGRRGGMVRWVQMEGLWCWLPGRLGSSCRRRMTREKVIAWVRRLFWHRSGLCRMRRGLSFPSVRCRWLVAEERRVLEMGVGIRSGCFGWPAFSIVFLHRLGRPSRLVVV